MLAKQNKGAAESRQALLKRLRDEAFAPPETPPSAHRLEEKEELLSRLKRRLDATIGSRRKAIERYDNETRERKLRVSQMEKEIRQAKKALAGGGTRSKPRKKALKKQ